MADTSTDPNDLAGPGRTEDRNVLRFDVKEGRKEGDKGPNRILSLKLGSHAACDTRGDKANVVSMRATSGRVQCKAMMELYE
ncbi:hypothetical protein E2C01_090283 [Portunus trituberculatus]|uniref:Uncharacterized protein n=1 Tax=Portunus trituberculatus TaxID=210409 RepID=A0A5B7JPP6_PORTR|nr:hypothetical protein [Portunus trituberculatus]